MTSTQPTPSTEVSPFRSAIVYVGPLSWGITSGKTAVGVCSRITDAFAIRADDPEAAFEVSFDGSLAQQGTPSYRLRKTATIQRTTASPDAPVCEVFEYEWAGAVVEQWNGQNHFARFLKSVVALLRVGRFMRFLKTSAKKNAHGRLQLWLGWLGAAAILLSTVVLAIAIVQLSWTAVAGLLDDPSSDNQATTTTLASTTTTTAASAPESQSIWTTVKAWLAQARAWIVEVWAIVFLVLAAIFRTPLKHAVAAGSALLAVEGYVRLAEQRPAAVGELVRQFDDLTRVQEYHQIDFIAYSFGTIIAMDTFFPRGVDTAPALSKVKCLVTIGTPLDYVRAVAPGYFDRRRWRPQTPAGWRNVYSPVDLLGSNFRDDSTEGNAAIALNDTSDTAATVQPSPGENRLYDSGVEVTVLNALVLAGFSAHGTYWGADGVSDQNALVDVIGDLYVGTPMLARL